jgi:hypothetical protein
MARRRALAPKWTTLVVVVVFAVAMAYLEAAVVVYLRELFHITGELVKFTPSAKDIVFQLPYFTLLRPGAMAAVLPKASIAGIEVGREAATIAMLAAVGWLAGHDPKSRIAYFLAAFGVWDIGYYGFLRILIGWPGSLRTLDVLFLIPGPWVAPVFLPVAISVLMIAGAVLLLRKG